jgi:hypothetical protein|tara:strand:+ start:637 stop:756 length:120 start_codon:yes stop_codon:yes gene_type:complete
MTRVHHDLIQVDPSLLKRKGEVVTVARSSIHLQVYEAIS